uniref:Peptidase C1A papain C-terminal domain-containing protein n=1 Tax=Wuchereria bancrofti TaxID=6293 RepID=A0AAF5Q816_WUCBA
MLDEFPVVKFNDTDDNPIPQNLTDKPVEAVNWKCGEAAAAAFVGVFEALAKSQTKKLRKLSVQELIDCSGSCSSSFGSFANVIQLLDSHN